mgnify:CR=1 FL=1
MKKNIKLVRIIIAAVIFIAGLVLGINGYSKRMSDSYADAKSVIKAYKENADSVSAGALKTAEATINSTDMLYAIGLVLVVIGIVILIAALTAPKNTKNVPIIVLAEAALLAALCYVGAGYLKIDIPVGTEKTMFHLGNVFCVLAALLLGGMWGGLAGAVGMTLSDLMTGYVTSAPKTFLLKLCIGLIVGLVAHKVFKIAKEGFPAKRLPVAVVVSCIAGMAFNVVADPIVGYFYKTYLLGTPQELAKALAEKIGELSVTLKMKAGEGGRAFGSVSSKEIAVAAKDQLGLEIDKKKMVLPEAIKTFGTHEVPVKLHKDVTAKLTVKVTEA